MQNDFSNLSGRAPGRFVSLASLALPGVRSVQQQVAPFADAWRRRNAEVLAPSSEVGGPLWVALGDSMTLGIGASAPDQGWVGQLATGMTGWRVLNLAINGGRVRDVLDRQLPVLEGLAEPPELITLLIGSNDLMSPRLRKSLSGDLATLLARLPVGTVVGNQPGGYRAALRVNRMIDDAVTEQGLVLAELRDPRTRNWRNKLAADRFHPNDRGYRGIAEVFGEAIERVIG